MVSTQVVGVDVMTALCAMLKDAFSRLCSGGSKAEGEGLGGWGGAEGEEPCNMEAGGGGAEEEGPESGGYVFGRGEKVEVCGRERRDNMEGRDDMKRRDDLEREQLLVLLCGGLELLKLMR